LTHIKHIFECVGPFRAVLATKLDFLAADETISTINPTSYTTELTSSRRMFRHRRRIANVHH
jgi:hypothetical protein